jgi:hypothetical protein
VPVTLSFADEAMNIGVGAASGSWQMRGTVWLVLYDRARTVDIGHGENEGRAVTYSHVVRKMQRLQMWKGSALSLSLPESELYESGADGCVVILQTEAVGGRPGTILGAAQIERHRPYGP